MGPISSTWKFGTKPSNQTSLICLRPLFSFSLKCLLPTPLTRPDFCQGSRDDLHAQLSILLLYSGLEQAPDHFPSM